MNILVSVFDKNLQGEGVQGSHVTPLQGTLIEKDCSVQLTSSFYQFKFN
jgi:hypothetical protein